MNILQGLAERIVGNPKTTLAAALPAALAYIISNLLNTYGIPVPEGVITQVLVGVYAAILVIIKDFKSTPVLPEPVPTSIVTIPAQVQPVQVQQPQTVVTLSKASMDAFAKSVAEILKGSGGVS